MEYAVRKLVRIKGEKIDSINEYARIEKITDTGVYVGNSNMPFQGTFCYKFFTFDQIEEAV